MTQSQLMNPGPRELALRTSPNLYLRGLGLAFMSRAPSVWHMTNAGLGEDECRTKAAELARESVMERVRALAKDLKARQPTKDEFDQSRPVEPHHLMRLRVVYIQVPGGDPPSKPPPVPSASEALTRRVE